MMLTFPFIGGVSQWSLLLIKSDKFSIGDILLDTLDNCILTVVNIKDHRYIFLDTKFNELDDDYSISWNKEMRELHCEKLK